MRERESVCVMVTKNDRERESVLATERMRERERVFATERMRERERERVLATERMRERERERERVLATERMRKRERERESVGNRKNEREREVRTWGLGGCGQCKYNGVHQLPFSLGLCSSRFTPPHNFPMSFPTIKSITLQANFPPWLITKAISNRIFMQNTL